MSEIDKKLFRKLADENRSDCGRKLIRKNKVRVIYFNITGYFMSDYEYRKHANMIHNEDYQERIKL